MTALAAEALARRPLAHLGGRGRLGERPSLLDDALDEQLALLQTESGVSVKLHPVTRMNNVLRDYS